MTARQRPETRRLSPVICSALLLALAGLTGADSDLATPVGRWKTIDDESGQPKSIVELWQEGGTIKGRIVKAFRDTLPESPLLCHKCPGDKKGQPIKGLEFLWGLKRSGDEWVDGRILDPNKGKVYDSKVRVLDGGRRLKVRGYLGLSLLGRTQIWERVE